AHKGCTEKRGQPNKHAIPFVPAITDARSGSSPDSGTHAGTAHADLSRRAGADRSLITLLPFPESTPRRHSSGGSARRSASRSPQAAQFYFYQSRSPGAALGLRSALAFG